MFQKDFRDLEHHSSEHQITSNSEQSIVMFFTERLWLHVILLFICKLHNDTRIWIISKSCKIMSLHCIWPSQRVWGFWESKRPISTLAAVWQIAPTWWGLTRHKHSTLQWNELVVKIYKGNVEIWKWQKTYRHIKNDFRTPSYQAALQNKLQVAT